MKILLILNSLLQRGAALVARCSLITLLVLVLLSTGTRFFGITATFAEEFIRYNVILLVSLGMGYTLFRRGHVSVGLIPEFGSSHAGGALRLLISLLSIALCAFIIRSSYAMWTLSYSWGMRSSSDWGVLLWPLQFLLFLGFVLLALQLAVDAVVHLRTAVTGKAPAEEIHVE